MLRAKHILRLYLISQQSYEFTTKKTHQTFILLPYKSKEYDIQVHYIILRPVDTSLLTITKFITQVNIQKQLTHICTSNQSSSYSTQNQHDEFSNQHSTIHQFHIDLQQLRSHLSQMIMNSFLETKSSFILEKILDNMAKP